MAAVTDLTISELSAAYARRELSPVEVAREHLRVAGILDGRVNAFCLVDTALTMTQAAQSEKRWRDGVPLSRIDGVPITIKDSLLVEGWPMLKGSTLVDPLGPWDEDAPSVASVRAAGAVFLGRTTAPEFAWKGVTDSALNGVTTNPWDTSRTSGGSSGGSAASVAAHVGRFSLGSDGGGSIRIPASFCGVVGLKPTRGRVPTYPTSSFGIVSHVGPLASSVSEIAEAMDVVARHDPRDPDCDRDRVPRFVSELRPDLSRLRVGFCPSLDIAGNRVAVQPAVAAAVEAAVARLADLVAEVELVEPPFADPINAFNVIWSSATTRVLLAALANTQSGDSRGLAQPQSGGLSGYAEDALRSVDPALRAIAETGAKHSAADYLEALTVRQDVGRAMSRFHARFDLLVTPTLPITAFEAGVDVPPGSGLHTWTDWTPFTYPFNLTGQPAISLPCGLDDQGLPIGIQLVGPRFSDELVVGVALALEEALALTMTPPIVD